MKHCKQIKNPVAECYALLFGMTYVYGSYVFRALDWLGEKLVYLIDHSDFFAGVVLAFAAMAFWELLTR